MKILDITFRILLGGVFILFGLSKFHAFMPTPPMTSAAANFIGAIISTGYLWKVVGLFEVVGGILVLHNRTAVIGLLILSPIIVNIILYLMFLQYSIGLAPFVMVGYLLVTSGFLAWRRSSVLLGIWKNPQDEFV
ncbi:MAG: DoxX family membrane protein [Leptospiraceae bacterium]|nr:DoxX family membrane protein [Leptospiraceae bacterium]